MGSWLVITAFSTVFTNSHFDFDTVELSSPPPFLISPGQAYRYANTKRKEIL